MISAMYDFNVEMSHAIFHLAIWDQQPWSIYYPNMISFMFLLLSVSCFSRGLCLWFCLCHIFPYIKPPSINQPLSCICITFGDLPVNIISPYMTQSTKKSILYKALLIHIEKSMTGTILKNIEKLSWTVQIVKADLSVKTKLNKITLHVACNNKSKYVINEFIINRWYCLVDVLQCSIIRQQWHEYFLYRKWSSVIISYQSNYGRPKTHRCFLLLLYADTPAVKSTSL